MGLPEMSISVTAYVEAYEVLEELSDAELAGEVERRREAGAKAFGTEEHHALVALRCIASGDIEGAVIALNRSLPKQLKYAPEANAAYAAVSQHH